MIAPLATAAGYDLEEVEIADSDALLERYKFTIPVAKNSVTGEELNWPFSEEQISSLLG